MEILEEKQRVSDAFLGSGTVVKIINGSDGRCKQVFGYMVLFDKQPPLEYNGGANPCLRWISDLKQIL